MHTFAPALAVVAALMWPAAASAQSLGEVAQREAARKKAEAAEAQKPASAAAHPQNEVEASDQNSGQPSLAEIARREAARRKAIAASGQKPKVLTTGDVKKWEPPQDTTKPESGDAAAATKADPGKSADDQKSADKTEAADAKKDAAGEPKGEQYWRARMSGAREELRRNESFAEALQSRINALSAEYSSKDDPYQRGQVADDRQKALAELDRLTEEIGKNKKAISDIEDDARRAGVPAGWIR